MTRGRRYGSANAKRSLRRAHAMHYTRLSQVSHFKKRLQTQLPLRSCTTSSMLAVTRKSLTRG